MRKVCVRRVYPRIVVQRFRYPSELSEWIREVSEFFDLVQYRDYTVYFTSCGIGISFNMVCSNVVLLTKLSKPRISELTYLIEVEVIDKGFTAKVTLSEVEIVEAVENS